MGFNDLCDDDKHAQEQDCACGLYLSQVITDHCCMAAKLLNAVVVPLQEILQLSRISVAGTIIIQLHVIKHNNIMVYCTIVHILHDRTDCHCASAI